MAVLRALSAVAIGVVAFAASHASAAGSFQFTFEGDARLVGSAHVPPPTIDMTTWSLTYTFDTSDPGTAGPDIANFDIRTYQLTSFIFEFNNVVIPQEIDIVSPDEGITVADATTMTGADSYAVELTYASSVFPIPPMDQPFDSTYDLNLIMSGPSNLWNSSALPTSLDLEDFTLISGGSLVIDLASVTSLYDLTITDFTSRKIPEPGALVLLSSALVIFVSRRR